MDFSFKLDRDDYRAITRVNLLRNRKSFSGLLFWLYILLMGTYILILQGFSFLPLLFVFIAICFLLFSYFYKPRLRKQAEDVGETNWIVTDDRVIIENDRGKVSSTWQLFCNYLDLRDQIFLFLADNPSDFMLIPTRAFESSDDINKFKNLVENNVKKRGVPYWLKHWYLIIAYIAIFVLMTLAIRDFG